MPGSTEKFLEKLSDSSLPSGSSSCGSHGGDEKDPATYTGGTVPGLEYVMVNVEAGMAAEGKSAISQRLISGEGI